MSEAGRPFKHTEKKLAERRKPKTDAATSARMGRIRQHGTAPELLVRHAWSALGMHYRTRNPDLPGSPDLANRSRGWAIFVHGCFWHRHRRCPKATVPRSNASFWLAKFARNAERDRWARSALVRLGYRVLVVWQCEAEAPAVLERRLEKFAREIGRRAGSRRRV